MMPTPSQPAPTVKQNVALSGAELRAFVASLKGKSAAEAMGAVARSGLARGLLVSVVLQALALAALTVPYALWPKQTAATSKESPAPAIAPSQPQPTAQSSMPETQPVERQEPAPARPAPTAPIKPATGDPEDLDAADAIDRGVEQ